MSQCQRPTTKTTIVKKCIEVIERCITLQFGKLTDIKIISINPAPPQKDVGRALGKALSKYHPAALVSEGQFEISIRLKNRALRLFDLEKKGIVTFDAL